MPTIDITLGPADATVKQQLVEQLTATAADLTGIPTEKFVVYVRELEFENIGVGGRTIAAMLADQQ